ncbi:uncharacterized protein MKK02DRAFT_27798 [Dioszegia hungarica]|uniref:Protein CPL1-like domain-containing protein n=1 Tax=Dioszegia hungarica TaxID=4972 RepID=A0AA38H926_9TREE|nr:uncharacterized protein MKK02DRAFT_27798 [Dioszegia hungarica]KAI9634614.1 hypothetical protein MKK02DRAFT_27798 [Dioszegia hungarica]
MLASILSLGILALSPLAAAQLFHGCVSSSFNSGTAQAAGTGSVAACNSACGTKYFYYRAAATSPCQCSDTDPYRFTPAQTTLVWMRQTTFQFGGCYATSAPNGAARIISKAGSLAIIADYCKGERTVAFSLDPSGDRTYNGYCGGVGTNVPSSPQPCAEGSTQRYYTHSAIAAASQLARRNVRLARRKVEGPNYCPGSLSACNVEGVEGSYECLDTKSELESCGGCIYGIYGNATAVSLGQDCTKMKGARPRSATCTRGRCVAMACQKGFRLIRGECLI